MSDDTIVCVGTPSSPVVGATLIVPEKATDQYVAGNYTEGEAVVYLCPDSGYGYLAYKCLSNGSFSEPDRTCDGKTFITLFST